MNTTLNNIIDDCNTNTHFSKKFFKEFSTELHEQLFPIIDDLNEKIYYQFRISIQMINISSEIRLLNNLASLVGSKDVQNRLIFVENDLYQIDRIFKRIILLNARLPIKFTIETLNEVKQCLIFFLLFQIYLFSLNYSSKK